MFDQLEFPGRPGNGVAIGAFAALLAVAAGCAGIDDVVPMPEPLIGTWTTTEARYHDRFFVLSETRLVIGTGAGTEVSYVIDEIHQGRADTDVLYTIDYHDAQLVAHTMSFYFDGEEGGVLRLKNQPRIAWRKSAS